MIMNLIQFNSIYVDQMSFNFPFGGHGFIVNLCQGSSWSISWFGADALIVVRDSGRAFRSRIRQMYGCILSTDGFNPQKKKLIRNTTTTKKGQPRWEKNYQPWFGSFQNGCFFRGEKMKKPRLPPNWIMVVLNLGPVAHNKVLIPKQVPMRCYTENPETCI